jgi:hypothetical protein
MRKLVIFFSLIFFFYSSFCQNVYTLKADSIKLANGSGNTELIIQNSTRNIPGYLFNTGNGKTEFRIISSQSALTFANGLTNNTNVVTNNLSTGVSGGQSVIGGTGAGDNLFLSSTTNTAKGKIVFGTSVYDETNNYLGLGYANPTNTLHVGGTGLRVDGWFDEYTSNPGVYLGINPDDNTPRVSFANGNPEQTWQIDNSSGNFRWYLPGSTQMVLNPASLTLNDKIIYVSGIGNNYFAGKIGIGQTEPTALLHLNAGTAATGTAPLKFTAGVKLTAPEDGAIEYDGSHFYGTVGSMRYQLDQQASTGNQLIAISSSSNPSYTLALTDNGSLVTQNVASPNSVTVPPNYSVAFPVGSKIMVNQYGTGQVSIVEGPGVVINSPGGALKLRAQYGTATLIKVATDTWILNGDLSNTTNTVPTYDADAQKFIDSAGISDSTMKVAINNLVKQLKDSSLWAAFKAIYPMAGGTASTTKWNLKDPRNLDDAFRITWNGSPDFKSTGVTCLTTSAWGNTHLSDSLLSYNNSSISFYSGTKNQIAGYDMGCSNGIYPYNIMAIYEDFDLDIVGTWFNSYDTIQYQPVNTSGLFTLTSNGTVAARYDQGVLYKNYNSNTLNNSYTNSVITIGGIIDDPYIGLRECRFASIGNGLTAAQVSAFYNIVQNFETALGRDL